MAKKNKTVQKSVMLTPWQLEQFQTIAQINDRSLSAQLRIALNEWLESKGIKEVCDE